MTYDELRYEEKALIAMFYFTQEQELKNQIKNIPIKYFSSFTADFFREYKRLELSGLPVESIGDNPKFKDILLKILDEYIISSYSKFEDCYKSLKLDYLKKRALEIANLDKTKIIEATAELYSEAMNEVESNIKKADMSEMGDIFFENLKQKDTVKTGKIKFDKYINFTKRNLAVIGARPGTGKSAFALYLSLLMGKENKGLFFSLEMSLAELQQRIIAMETSIPLSDLKLYDSLDEQKKKRISQAIEELKELNLKFYDGNFKIEQLEEIIKTEKEVNGLDFIVVDYLQLIKSTKNGSRYEQITDVSIRLKQLAKEYDIAIISLAQLSREIDKRTIKSILLSDFRDSGQIEQDASIILGLTSEEVRDIEYKHILTVEILKNRQGRLGRLEYEYYKNNQTFYEMNRL